MSSLQNTTRAMQSFSLPAASVREKCQLNGSLGEIVPGQCHHSDRTQKKGGLKQKYVVV